MVKPDKFGWWDEFITEYLKNGQNATAAYLKVKPKTAKRTAEVCASRLLRNVEFSERLEAARKKLEQKHEMSREKWIRIVAEKAQVNIGDFIRIDSMGDVDIKENALERHDTHGIEAIDARTTTNEEGQVFRKVFIKKENTAKNLEMLGKALGYLSDKVEHSGDVVVSMKELIQMDLAEKENERKRSSKADA